MLEVGKSWWKGVKVGESSIKVGRKWQKVKK